MQWRRRFKFDRGLCEESAPRRAEKATKPARPPARGPGGVRDRYDFSVVDEHAGAIRRAHGLAGGFRQVDNR